MNKRIASLLALALMLSGCVGVVQVMSTPQPPAVPPPGATPAATTAHPTQTPGNGSTMLTPAIALTPSATSMPTTSAPVLTPLAPTPITTADIDAIIDWEMRGAFDFFWEQATTDPTSPGYGLIRDRYPGNPGVASIASVGFGLTAIPIGIDRGWITREQGEKRSSKTLDTLLNMDRTEGFYFHFVDMKTGKRAWKSEVSNIDTSILLMGVLFAGEYFGGEVQAKANKIYEGVNWPWYYDAPNKAFWMGYKPEEGFFGHWDFYAEQLMLYVLAAGSPTHPVGADPYYSFTRQYGSFDEGKPFIHSWYNSIFTYQYSHAWIDFKPYTDKQGVNWFDNSVAASQEHVDYATFMAPKYETLGPNAWGLTASDGPNGYEGRYGAPPSGSGSPQHFVDDTIAPCGAIGSIIFVPEAAERAMLNYAGIEKLKGKYGFVDAYNLDKNWYDADVIGIDKGISLLMLANYQDELVHRIAMKNTHLLNGLERLGFKKQ